MFWDRLPQIECEPRSELEATLKHERSKPDGGDKDLIAALIRITSRRALAMEDDKGFPRVLLDEADNFKF